MKPVNQKRLTGFCIFAGEGKEPQKYCPQQNSPDSSGMVAWWE